MAQPDVLRRLDPAEVDVAGLVAEPAPERGWERGGLLPVEVPSVTVPHDVPTRQHDQQVRQRLALAPVADLAGNPLGAGRLWRGEQDEEPRAGQRLLDRRPETRVRRQARLVPEHPQGPQPMPRPRELVEGLLQCRGQPAVNRVAVGDEGVVGPRGRHRPVGRPPRRELRRGRAPIDWRSRGRHPRRSPPRITIIHARSHPRRSRTRGSLTAVPRHSQVPSSELGARAAGTS